MIFSQRRGVAELTGALIMIILTVAGFGLYYGAFQNRIANNSDAVIQQYQAHQRGVGEMLSLVYSSAASGTATVYIYNYGSTPVAIQRATLTDGVGVSTAASWTVCTVLPADCGAPSASLPSGSLSVVDFPYTGNTPVSLVLVTSNYAVFQFPLSQGVGD